MKEIPFIQWTEENEATGEVGRIYRRWLKANPGRDSFPAILKCFGGNAAVLQGVLDFCYPLQFTEGKLDRRIKETLATYVSALNRCKY